MKDGLKEILRSYKNGEIGEAEAERLIDSMSIIKLSHTSIDAARERRCGAGEVIYGAGKTPSQIIDIARAMVERGSGVLATRLSPESAEAFLREFPRARYCGIAGAAWINSDSPKPRVRGEIAVVSAGTSDMPVAEEARVTAEFLGSPAKAFYDCGVAGIHRLADRLEDIRKCSAIVAVAGMEGALASVLAGLVSVPVFAVPTSVGYGASFGGISALLSMINSCANGVSVVNIDNGFGAGYCAHLANRL